jgi:hypothetical protein
MTLPENKWETWTLDLDNWIKEQHGTAGWEQKLENFIAEQRKQAVDEYIEKRYKQESSGQQ